MNDFHLTEEKVKIVNRCIELAEEHFESSDSDRYGEVCWWDDGDLRVEIVHGFGMKDGEEYVHHAEQVRYKQSADRIVYSEYEMDMLGHRTTSLEQYTIEEDIND